MNEHDEDCTCLACLIECGDVPPDAIQCPVCGHIDGHKLDCTAIRNPFYERIGPI